MRRLLLLLCAIAIASSVALTGVTAQQNCGGTVTVTDTNMNGWTDSSTEGANVSFVNGPTMPPLGVGSAQLSVGPNSTDDTAAQLRNPNYAGTKLSQLTALTYSTFVSHDGSGGQAPYIILNVDYDNNGTTDDLLFFEPVYQTAAFFPSNPQQALMLNTWQTWNALNGGWWSLNGTGGATPGTGVKPLSAIIAAFPNATIVNSSSGGGVRIVAGFGAGAWDNFVGNADAFTIGVNGCNTTYNFEPAIAPTTKDQCKNGGWQTFNSPAFKNQGQCVSFVATGGKKQ